MSQIIISLNNFKDLHILRPLEMYNHGKDIDVIDKWFDQWNYFHPMLHSKYYFYPWVITFLSLLFWVLGVGMGEGNLIECILFKVYTNLRVKFKDNGGRFDFEVVQTYFNIEYLIKAHITDETSSIYNYLRIWHD